MSFSIRPVVTPGHREGSHSQTKWENDQFQAAIAQPRLQTPAELKETGAGADQRGVESAGIVPATQTPI
jgi:hypothetical protein